MHTYIILWRNESDYQKPGACRPAAHCAACLKSGSSPPLNNKYITVIIMDLAIHKELAKSSH